MKIMNKGSLRIGKIFGIEVLIHWTFLLLIAYIVIMNRLQGSSLSEMVYTLLFIGVLFVCVTLHEMGHALTARKYGCRTRDIILLPIGGLARMEKLPEDPRQEIKVAIAGPLVNLFIALLLYVLLRFWIGLPQIMELSKINAETFVLNLLIANALLFAFNLIPAFPLDGGRILRGWLSLSRPKHEATRLAAGIGQLLAIVFVVIGLFSNPFLVFIGIFIYLGAQMESDYYLSRHVLSFFKVADVMMPARNVLNASDSLMSAANALLTTTATAFLVMRDGQTVGTINRREIVESLKENNPEMAIEEVMNKEVFWLKEDQALTDIYEKFITQKASLLPVARNGKLTGVVDRENIEEFLLIRQALTFQNKNTHAS